MKNTKVIERGNAEQKTKGDGTFILEKNLATLQYSVWDTDIRKGHAKFFGNVVETAVYLEQSDLDCLEVSALDLECMHSLEPVTAVKWLIWYYETALPEIEENEFNDGVRVPYPIR